MICLTILFSVKRPLNAEKVLSKIMFYVNLDVVDTEDTLRDDIGFNFELTEPFSPIFEKAGYYSTTFLLELGLIFPIICSFILFMGI